MNYKTFRYEVFTKAALARNFEEEVINNVKNKNIKIPVYVSAGQEYISSTISTICKQGSRNNWQKNIFKNG